MKYYTKITNIYIYRYYYTCMEPQAVIGITNGRTNGRTNPAGRTMQVGAEGFGGTG